MASVDPKDELRREAEAEARAAQARVESEKKQRAEQQKFLEERRASLAAREIGRAEKEIGRVEDTIGRLKRAENRARRQLGIKRGTVKRSDMQKIQEEAGTLHKKGKEEARLEHLKKQLGSLKGGGGKTGINSTIPRRPGGGLLRS